MSSSYSLLGAFYFLISAYFAFFIFIQKGSFDIWFFCVPFSLNGDDASGPWHWVIMSCWWIGPVLYISVKQDFYALILEMHYAELHWQIEREGRKKRERERESVWEREIWASESYLGLRFDTLVGQHSHEFLTAGCLSFLLKKKVFQILMVTRQNTQQTVSCRVEQQTGQRNLLEEAFALNDKHSPKKIPPSKTNCKNVLWCCSDTLELFLLDPTTDCYSLLSMEKGRFNHK